MRQPPVEPPPGAIPKVGRDPSPPSSGLASGSMNVSSSEQRAPDSNSIHAFTPDPPLYGDHGGLKESQKIREGREPNM